MRVDDAMLTELKTFTRFSERSKDRLGGFISPLPAQLCPDPVQFLQEARFLDGHLHLLNENSVAQNDYSSEKSSV